MQSTANYLWHTDDLLGQGATASVYKARNKKSGELVAVKVFNTTSYLRPREVQVREFEVLRKLNHQNIVKLFAVEETGGSRQKVLVMEYCSSGSLLSVLESPENAFGLPEDEFLVVLRCVVAGMNHLRENGIVHRDIKPGNIMRLVGEEGQSIYKLTDFGAARELDDDEKFVSVYGTEEYLHPDMYERAVLRKPQQKAFGVTVDLWSIGVTLYHAATGSLPFIPFGGPRRNKEIMHRITTEKPAGAIAGAQRRENGPLEWSYTLPITCQLSLGLQSQLVPILANILEVEQAKCWGFDQFFAETSDILQRVVVHVFSLSQAVLHHIYIHAHNTIAIFQEAVHKQTSVAPRHQEYLFEGHLCVLEPSVSAQHIAHTTASSPLTLFSTAIPKGLAFRDPALDIPKFVPKVDLQADYNTAKGVLGAGYQALRLARALLDGQELMLRGLHWVMEVLQATCRRTLEVARTSLLYLSSSLGTERFSSVAGTPEIQELKAAAELRSRLRTLAEVLSRCSQNITETQESLSSLSRELVKSRDQVHEDRSIQQIQCCLDKMNFIYKQFKKSRMRPGLGYNEEQIHKLDKVNFSHLAKRLLQVFQEECVQKYQASLVTHGKRMRVVHETRNHLRLVGCSVAACNTEAQGVQESLSKLLEELSHQLLQDRAKGAQASPPPIAPYPSPTRKDLLLHMQELCEGMKLLASDLLDNNRIIERLNTVPAPPDV
ncbi:inhibitor of nuclear factor kappa-B kinase subunit epsilon isoform X1 [Pongo abelii]|uniref:Inhibitor of nuclear factor kappa-B kinase subunit epsilon n=2 Tax=Pongo abelii TaxID=9601 RepID=A0A6D2Y6J8_PONAB|nr:inhibitor of nuclear factor kappa-B kinase subunit epsilon isoform X1 [Pongo abelii]XP_009236820.1 inhibitor of nuclear factor kappa-B kinase subunit epsilon isoform X1 [Pongo abelii]XP_009236822.1 inhibitor of nuclear factor kappa-B kinase subunit epsilon isoform X1 [Pongo abelii]XP_009236826.1 inhibitor of nuclear factor kappa-B kinase subunit epsilon isoform X1 [Pongo abelii]XP_054377877.1 inhibitor of nuclear factor kappa-B kinase subunit epsilon isoform X1 [Pongo abelii]PNJ53248.1 IKBK